MHVRRRWLAYGRLDSGMSLSCQMDKVKGTTVIEHLSILAPCCSFS